MIFDFSDVPELFVYNDHYSIIILNENNEQQDLPYYYDADNNDKTNKRTIVEIRILNWREYDVKFKVAIYLYQGLFQPYLSLLKNKVSVVFYNANR